MKANKRCFLILIFWSVLSLQFAFAGTQAIYYVDAAKGNDNNPGTSVTAAFKTILKAQTIVRGSNTNMFGDIYVYLRGGNYALSATLVFDDRDAGTNGYNIIYAAFPNEIPIISGEKKITGWGLYDKDKLIYSAAAGSNVQTRQLFINGKRAVRARTFDPLANLTIDTDIGHTTSSLAIASWKNTSDIEMVYQASWTNPRCGVSAVSVNGGTALITMKQPGWLYCTNKGITSVGGNFSKAPIFIENAYELLDSVGEWYLDRTGAINGIANTFYYKPYTGEDMTTVDAAAPVLEKLILLQGRSIANPVHHVQFKGIFFKYTTWLRPSGNNGHADAQNNIIRETGHGERIVDGAAICMKYANNVLLERCGFRQLGGIGVEMYPGCQNNIVRGCSFTDISANGIQVGDVYGAFNDASYEAFCKPTDTRFINKNITISNNYLDKCGVDYQSSCAIAAVFPQDMYIGHNEIGNMPYSGIHIGWGQGGDGLFSYSIARNNIIRNNYIHNTVAALDDAAPIYVCGAQDSVNNFSRIDSNHCISSRDNGLYFDGGSCWWKADMNVLQDIATVNINISSPLPNNAANPLKHDIAVTNTYAEKNYYWNYGVRTTVATNLVTTNGLWPATALLIMDSAGLQADYIDIRATSYLNDNFNTNVTGVAPLGWIVDISGGTVTTSNIIGNSDQCVGLYKAATANAVSANNSFRPVSGKVTITFKVRTESLTDTKVLPNILDRNGVVAATIVMKDGNLQLSKGGTDFTLIQTFQAAQWYDVKAVLNTETSKVDVYVNGALKVYQDNFRNKVADISQLQFGIDVNYAGIAYFDNVSVYTDQNFVNDNFSEFKVGNEPAGWKTITTGGSVMVDTVIGSSNKIMNLVKSSVANFVIASKNFGPIFKNVVVTAKVRSTSTTGWKNVCYLFDRFNKTAVSIILKDGNIQVYNGTSYTTAIPFTANEWYTIKLLLNIETDKFDLYVNDVLRLNQISCRTKVSDVAKLEFGIGDGFNGTLQVDDVQVYNSPTSPQIILPVNLISLTATAIDNKAISVKWVTSLEVNNKYFIVQHSTNGIDFYTIDTVASKSKSYAQTTYSITDISPISGINYYRLLQIDIDGKSTLSNTVFAIITPNDINAFSVFPNPSHSNVTLRVNCKKQENISMVIVDNKGAIIQSKKMALTVGTQYYNINIAALPTGVYNISLIFEKEIITQQIIKQ